MSHAGSGELTALQKATLALKQMRARLDEAERARREPIAVVGLSCRFPGAADASAFWHNLTSGVDSVGPIPDSRWNQERYYDPDPAAAGKMYARTAGLLDSIDRFDPVLFGISPREAAAMDPQQRLMLEGV